MLNTMNIALKNESEIKNPLRSPKKKEKLTGVAYVGDKNCKYSYDWFTDQ